MSKLENKAVDISKRQILLNQPIDNYESDWIGVSEYVERLSAAIEQGAKVIGIISEFGAGKSSIISLYKKQKENTNVHVLSVNMWDSLNNDSTEINSKDLHKSLIYQIVKNIDSYKGSYISKRLSKNYGLISLQGNNRAHSYSSLFLIILFCISIVFSNFNGILIDRFPDYSESIKVVLLVIEIVSFALVIALNLCGTELVFSSSNSEGKREIDENVIMDFYKKEVVDRAKNTHYVIVVEDLDRTNELSIVDAFLKELRKYYFNEEASISFVICIKPESLLLSNNINNNELSNRDLIYTKIFDYIISIPNIAIDNYDSILNGFLNEISRDLIRLKIANSEEDISVDKIPGMSYLIMGENIKIREIKKRLNLSICLYESLTNKFEGEKITFEKCAVAVYLTSEYESVFYSLKDKAIEHLIEKYGMGIEVEESSLRKLGVTAEFEDIIKSLIESNLVDSSYRTYFYNYPKDSKLYGTNDLVVYNSLIYCREPISEEEFKKYLDVVNEDVITDGFNKLKQLNVNFPSFILKYESLYAVLEDKFENELYRIIENLSYDTNNVVVTSELISECIGFCGVRKNRNDVLKMISSTLKKSIKDKNVLQKIRYGIACKDLNNILIFKELYVDDNPYITEDEINIIVDPFVLVELVNYSISIDDFRLCKIIHERINTIDSYNDIFDKFYVYIIMNFPKGKWNVVLQEYCRKIGFIPEVIFNEIKIRVNDRRYFSEEYIELLSNINIFSKDEMTLLSDLRWIKSMPVNVLSGLYDYELYTDYAVSGVVTDGVNVDFSDESLIKSIVDSADWIYKNAPDSYSAIKQIVLKRKNLTLAYMNFIVIDSRITEEELNSIENVDNAIMILSKVNLSINDSIMIANYFNKKCRNQTATYNIFKFISSLNMNIALKIFIHIDKNLYSYRTMAAYKRKEIVDNFNSLFDFNSNLDRLVLFLVKTRTSNMELEKDLYTRLKTDSEQTEKYINFVNDLKVINIVTLNNIVSIKKSIYSDVVNKKLFENKHYSLYISSKTRGEEKFTIEEDKKHVLWSSYVDMFNSKTGWDYTQSYMKANSEFVSELMETKEYMKPDIKIQNYREVLQNKEIIEYIFSSLETIELVEYMSNLKGFISREAAEAFINEIVKRPNIVRNDMVYKNCYEKLLDSGLKRRYTNARNKQER